MTNRTADDNLYGNPYIATIEKISEDILALDSRDPKANKGMIQLLTARMQAVGSMAAAWETRQLRRMLEADRDAAKTDPAPEEESTILADLTKPQSDATTPAKELNPGDIVLIPMVVQPVEDVDVVSLKPMERRLKFDVTGAWVFRNLASPVMFQRTVKGPAR